MATSCSSFVFCSCDVRNDRCTPAYAFSGLDSSVADVALGRLPCCDDDVGDSSAAAGMGILRGRKMDGAATTLLGGVATGDKTAAEEVRFRRTVARKAFEFAREAEFGDDLEGSL